MLRGSGSEKAQLSYSSHILIQTFPRPLGRLLYGQCRGPGEQGQGGSISQPRQIATTGSVKLVFAIRPVAEKGGSLKVLFQQHLLHPPVDAVLPGRLSTQDNESRQTCVDRRPELKIPWHYNHPVGSPPIAAPKTHRLAPHPPSADTPE